MSNPLVCQLVEEIEEICPSKWINVNDEFPDHNKYPYIVYLAKYPFEGAYGWPHIAYYYIGHNGGWMNNGTRINEGIVWWIGVPEYPQKID